MKRRGGYNRRERNSENGERRMGGDSRSRVYEHSRWNPPLLSTEPLPMPNCSCCGQPIRDITIAVDDKTTGAPAHFDCIIRRLMETEHIEEFEKGDTIAYIGGGRFGIVRFSGSRDKSAFKILKVFEWENKDNRAEWRKKVSDQYSLT